MSPTISAARQAIDAARVVITLAGAEPTTHQRVTLSSFPGWGPASGLFESQPTGTWAVLADQLDDVATSKAITAAGRVVDTSFFTPAPLIAHMYQLLVAAGFTGGAILDLGCGSGRFLEHAPAGLNLAYTGVDADPISAQIAAALHPTATILTGELQSITLPRRFAAAIGNVPFSAAHVYDSVLGYSGSLHDYFLLRAVKAVRPGGYVVMVTSRHTLDNGLGLCGMVSHVADMVAAIRLPSRYFAAEGTDVVADVVVLRVRDHDGAEPQGWQPGNRPTTEMRATVDGRPAWAHVSSYWAARPEHVAGTMRLTGYHANPVAVDVADAARAVAEAFTDAQQYLISCLSDSVTDDYADVVLVDAEGRKEGSFHVADDGQVVRLTDGALIPVKRPTAELRELIKLRDAATELLAAEADWDQPDEALEPARTACRELYIDYARRFGPLNRGELIEGGVDDETGMPELSWKTPRLGGFRSDPDSPVVLALERYDRETGIGSPAPILLRRVNRRPQPVTRAQSPAAALAISLGEGRGVDLERIRGLLDLTDRESAAAALGDLVYRDPDSGATLTARDYLCGDVRYKLRRAVAAAAGDPQFARNVTALEAVQPTWLTRADIRIELGSPWVTPHDIAEFSQEVFGCRARVDHVAPLAYWEVDGYANGMSAEAKLAYNTQRLDALQLLQIGLNGKSPVVKDEVYDKKTHVKRHVRNSEATEQAEQKLAAIAERFSIWIWESRDRETRIVEQYNQAMNSRVARRHDGTHLTFPGLADGTDLWPWQRDFVDQAVSTPGAFASHPVGYGKTLSAIATAMTLRQFGLANRPAYIVPNHLIEQATALAYQAYPAGRFLIVSRDDLHRTARRRFMARCATGDWDLVIMTHECFSKIPVPPQVERDWAEDQLSDLENYTRGRGDTAKAVARAARSWKGRLDKLRGQANDPGALTFDKLGIDYLAVDEADRFRRLPVNTRAEGFSMGSSKRATDLELKISMLRRANPGRPHAAFFTGTPWSNTLAEAYVWQRYLAPGQLTGTGMEHFDGWAAQFIRYESIIEVAPDGSGFRSKRRPSVIQNLPELRCMLSEFMSMVDSKASGLTRPTPVHHTVVVEPTAAQETYMETLVTRADALRRRKPSAGDDNILVICTDGRKIALDPHLVGIAEPSPKLEAVAQTVAAVYHRTRHLTYPGSEVPGAFHLVLCDLGTPHPADTQCYGRIRAALVRLGVPAGDVRFVHEATSPQAREALFARCRSGQVPILIGSTPTVGVGTNIQARMIALHNVDPTFTAAQWAQRLGRIDRHGNAHSRVDIYNYVTARTFDGFMFGLVERKSRGFEQLRLADATVREIADIGEATLNFAELKAAAAGNQLLLRQHEATVAVRKLQLAHVTTQQNVRALLTEAATAEQSARAATQRADVLASVIDQHLDAARIDLCRAARAVCEGRVSNDRQRDAWTNYRASVGFWPTRDTGGFELRFVAGYLKEVLWSASLPAAVRRAGPDVVAQWAHTLLEQWLAQADADLAHARSWARSLAQKAQRARDAADRADVREPAELTAARAELAAITRAITDELDDDAAA